jgi:hypothetical protein
MDGAVRSARRVTAEVLDALATNARSPPTLPPP